MASDMMGRLSWMISR